MHGRESEEQNQYIRNDKELVLVQLRKLKAQRTRVREIAQENLVKLTLESNATLKVLRAVVDKVTGERVVQTKLRNWAPCEVKRV